MAAPLLSTKLYVPPPRPNLVPRPHLVQRLEDGLKEGRRLTIVSAPPGFGKSTLLSDWAASTNRPVAWISLDVGDDDPGLFWSYVIAALQTIHPNVGTDALPRLISPTPSPIEEVLTSLINEILAKPGPFILILDDYHAISTAEVNDTLLFLVDNMPSQMHVAIAGRADPPWPLASMRVRGQITELRTEDLRFTASEVTTFLNRVSGLGLSPEDVATLDSRTEGWIAGLQLAALSIQGHSDAASFITSFSGSHRFVLDYLAEEVLRRQPAVIQDFLLRTSILDRLSASLCEAVVEIGGWRLEDGSQTLEAEGPTPTPLPPTSSFQSLLEYLETANLFLIPLDDVRRWYRYHHLFADLLRGQLERTQPDQLPILYRRASEWYEQNGLPAQAVEAALAGGDTERVARLAAGQVLSLVEHRQLSALRRGLERLPDDVVRSRPWLSVARAWILVFAGQLDKVEPLLKDAERAAAQLESKEEALNLRGYVAAVRHHLAALSGDNERGARLAREALAHLPEDDLITRSWATASLAIALYRGGDTSAADEVLAEAVSLIRTTGASHIHVMVLSTLGSAQLHRGQLRSAADTFRDALRLAAEYADRSGEQLPVSGYAHAYLARVLAEQNEMQAALEHMARGIELCELWGEPELLTGAYMCQARVLLAANDPGGALEAIGKAKRYAQGISSWYGTRPDPLKALVQLHLGDTSTASQWADAALDVFDRWEASIIRGQILVAQSHLSEALAVAKEVLDTAGPAEANLHVVRALILQALALDAQGNPDESMAALRKALALAQPEGYVQSFVSAGTPIRRLLHRATGPSATGKYAERLLSALEGAPQGHPRLSPLPSDVLVEPLSEREMQVIRLLVTGLTSTDIAEQLYISVHTARTHIKSIYGKLDVHSRREAIDKAQKLGLI